MRETIDFVLLWRELSTGLVAEQWPLGNTFWRTWREDAARAGGIMRRDSAAAAGSLNLRALWWGLGSFPRGIHLVSSCASVRDDSSPTRRAIGVADLARRVALGYRRGRLR